MRDVAAKFIQIRDSQVLTRDDFSWFSGAAASLLATANELSGTEGELKAMLDPPPSDPVDSPPSPSPVPVRDGAAA